MEGLKKLEQVQRTIRVLQSIGIINPSNKNADSDRFLANFTLLLVQHCGKLDITTKCQLIAEHIAKISTAYLTGALQCDSGEVGNQIESAVSLHCYHEADPDLVQSISDEVAMVRLDAMLRASSTLEDFCRSYFMFHKLDAYQPQSIFRYLPMLSFTESYIYQLDGLNEKLLQLPTGGATLLDRDYDEDELSLSSTSVRMLRHDPVKPLVVILEYHGLLTQRIKEELRSGVEYWALERKLCCALMSDNEISIEDAIRAIHLKSFDYRVLNLLLYHMRGEKVNELHMEFLSLSELLVEVSDDLFDYEAKFITEAEEKYDQLLKKLGPELSLKYQKRCEEATKEGGKTSGSPLGTWQLPMVVEDEAKYRTECSTSKS
ncbi:uncharacterized protein LOC111401159 isoform X2 [Olea europaea var. sylvestris]|uniref:uncharacterized protein LOC111401159 isoform X2 n=1 Tax=Olea europaea var. sylvestris TaxID=158386 RepID=UPI000C1D6B07|nr:uncharacterized protein LOC111401159 isoform X2 [Olea europaea var. sylvestris]